MSDTLAEFIKKARSKGLDDQQIKSKLVQGGWTDQQAADALDDLIVPPPPHTMASPVPHAAFGLHNQSADKPIAVVQNLSVRGFEYAIMFLTLWSVAISIIVLALSAVSDFFNKAEGSYTYGQGNTANAFFITVLIVSFPIFAFMFLRLKKAEFEDPALKQDQSRRKLVQITQLLGFITAMGFTIYFIYSLISPNDVSSGSPSALERLLDTLVAIAVAGGIFMYYWREDRNK